MEEVYGNSRLRGNRRIAENVAVEVAYGPPLRRLAPPPAASCLVGAVNGPMDPPPGTTRAGSAPWASEPVPETPSSRERPTGLWCCQQLGNCSRWRLHWTHLPLGGGNP